VRTSSAAMRTRRALQWCAVAAIAVAAASCAGARRAPEREAEPPAEDRPGVQEGLASYYGRYHHGKRTASGERFDMRAMTCAHRTLPFGTRLRVTDLESGRSVVVRVNDRGPFARGRVVDLSEAAAKALGILERGVARVRLEQVSDREALGTREASRR
jgi:rare lipoprotein A